jgi:hypothetical protein
MICRGILHEGCPPAVNSGDPLGANVQQYYIDSAISKDNSQGEADMAAPAYNDESCRFWHGSIRYSPFSPLHFHFNHNQSLSNPCNPAPADAEAENAAVLVKRDSLQSWMAERVRELVQRASFT